MSARLLVSVVLVAASMLLLSASAALAAPPPNDDFDSAVVVPGLPFTDSLDTVEATTAPGDPYCRGNEDTVWYRFTPTRDVTFVANTFGSEFDTTLSVYTGSRGSLSQIACNDDAGGYAQSQVVITAEAGTTYHLMVAAWGEGPGGPLVFRMTELPPPPAVSLSLDRTAVVDDEGAVTVRFTATCDQDLRAFSHAEAMQRFAQRFVTGGAASRVLPCAPPQSVHEIHVPAFQFDVPTFDVPLLQNPFVAGPANVEVRMVACNAGGCTVADASRNVVLTRRAK